MEPDRRQASPADLRLEVLRQPAPAQRAAILAGEHPAGVLPGGVPLQPLNHLLALPCLQHLGRARVDRDDPV